MVTNKKETSLVSSDIQQNIAIAHWQVNRKAYAIDSQEGFRSSLPAFCGCDRHTSITTPSTNRPLGPPPAWSVRTLLPLNLLFLA